MMKKLIILFLIITTTVKVYSQQSQVKIEASNFKTVEGRIAINLMVNGIEGTFILDLAGKTALLPEFAEKIGIDSYTETTLQDLPTVRKIAAAKKFKINTIAFGNNVFANTLTSLLLEGEAANYIKKLGVSGVISGSFFKNVVLTIDKKNGKIYTSTPFKPTFMRLTERTSGDILLGGIPEFEIKVNNKPTKVIFDTWETGTLSLISKTLIAVKPNINTKGKISGIGYSADNVNAEAFKGQDISVVNMNLKNKLITINPNLVKPVVGLGLLDFGLISIDFQNSKIYYQSYESTKINEIITEPLIKIEQGKVNAITKAEFIEYIYDYKSNKDFVFKGDKPVIIDFWATWCAPCMKMMPEMEKLATQYKDKVVFYKINADKEKELCSKLNIMALPYIIMVKPGQKPIIEIGNDVSKIVSIIENDLLK
ncbi:thioredoxin domain-containing protein [Pedobacter cryotolerans]|uniref:Redoxin domain-containing protein n=1 Tax=Pedobacter cryotolerans TaxID=2571270 RepID=A0A4U1BWC6_9SPHI|nr:thioredoxin domain-containing protein [Pedobacter cryotolerans]TKB97195.1 redoxin domain-containing protein [Pedobacter cryotolerans]